MGDYGIKGSIRGKDVKTAADKDLVISSKRKCLKIGEPITDSITTNGSGVATKTISHSKGFIPEIIVAINFNGALYFEPFNGLFAVYLHFYVTATATDFTINVSSFTNPNTTFEIYYWISDTKGAL